MVCLRNICINTLHKGAAAAADDDDNNNNNNINLEVGFWNVNRTYGAVAYNGCCC
jgi:hypothetical protein